MPAPDLTPQTPGEPIASTGTTTLTTPLAGAIAVSPAAPAFNAKHNGGGRWKIWSTTNDDWFSDFIAAGDGAKAQAETEAERLNAGGEPLVLDPQRTSEPAPKVQASTGNHDATTLKQAVLTNDGWLCPEPKAKD
ncbi:hypothetical protein HBO14_11225 [Pseudomonas sp. WS 5406]|uniref:hypothetical protein n=1 Tax=Pseudomonas sp. WS 5406 TaxID=2717498 RepID=UPI0014742B37|nr:hypothetical protein [Pseudomonas sp. WS 5406]NMX27097.1 hypothetical protein [Pseudomonas sp. WS 5406]